MPQIQTALNAGLGHLTQNRWNVPSERPETNSEETYGEKVKKNTRCEQRIDYQNDGHPHPRAYDRTETSLHFSFSEKFILGYTSCRKPAILQDIQLNF